jgi:hypothetical protein
VPAPAAAGTGRARDTRFITATLQFNPAIAQFSHRIRPVDRSLIDVDIRLKDTLPLVVFILNTDV